MNRLIKLFFIALLVSESIASANAQTLDSSIYGTHWVKYEPLQVGGELRGCSLVFLAVVADHLYLKGAPSMVNGAIQYKVGPNNRLALLFKVGVSSNIDMGKPQFERPYFSYLQADELSTYKVTLGTEDGELGYKIFLYDPTEETPSKVLQTMLQEGKVSIGFNRKKNGADVLVPIDLFVADSEYTDNGKVIRKTSPESLSKFIDCMASVTTDLMDKLEKK